MSINSCFLQIIMICSLSISLSFCKPRTDYNTANTKEVSESPKKYALALRVETSDNISVAIFSMGNSDIVASGYVQKNPCRFDFYNYTGFRDEGDEWHYYITDDIPLYLMIESTGLFDYRWKTSLAPSDSDPEDEVSAMMTELQENRGSNKLGASDTHYFTLWGQTLWKYMEVTLAYKIVDAELVYQDRSSLLIDTSKQSQAIINSQPHLPSNKAE